MPNAILFAPLIILIASWAIFGDYPEPRQEYYLDKPLATIAIRTGAAGGALLFIASDTRLGRNRFVAHFGAAQALILGTYVA